MRAWKRWATAGAVTLACITSVVAGEGQHHEHEAGHGPDELALERPPSGKWASDESLRTGMGQLRDAFQRDHAAYRAGNFGAGEAAALADAVDHTVNFLFANCRLPADADAELHKLLAAALGAAHRLREGDDARQGLQQLHRVLETYPDFFEHPDWPD